MRVFLGYLEDHVKHQLDFVLALLLIVRFELGLIGIDELFLKHLKRDFSVFGDVN